MDGVVAGPGARADRRDRVKIVAGEVQGYVADRLSRIGFLRVKSLLDESTRVVNDPIGSAVGHEVEVEAAACARSNRRIDDGYVNVHGGFMVCPKRDGHKREQYSHTGEDGQSRSGGVDAGFFSQGGGGGGGGGGRGEVWLLYVHRHV